MRSDYRAFGPRDTSDNDLQWSRQQRRLLQLVRRRRQWSADYQRRTKTHKDTDNFLSRYG
jgi:hypothetical protein